MREEAIKITNDGNTVTSGATSARITIPVNEANQAARIIRVICPVSATYAYVMAGNSNVVATTNSICVNDTELVLDVSGSTHVAHIQGSAAAVINIVPVEW